MYISLHIMRYWFEAVIKINHLDEYSSSSTVYPKRSHMWYIFHSLFTVLQTLHMQQFELALAILEYDFDYDYVGLKYKKI